MKKNNKMSELMALAFMLPSVAFAQASGSQGGGEDGVFKGIRDEVGTWIQKNIAINQLETKLELKSISGVALQASFNQAVADVGEKVVFTTQEIKIGDNSRICKNENKTITCNVDAWNNTRGDTRYMIVFHEYLGVAGIETNVEVDYSRYPISSKILHFVKTNESFELGIDRVETKKNPCTVYIKKQVDGLNKVLSDHLYTIGNEYSSIVFDYNLEVNTDNSGGNYITIAKLSLQNKTTVLGNGYGIGRNFSSSFGLSSQKKLRASSKALKKALNQFRRNIPSCPYVE